MKFLNRFLRNLQPYKLASHKIWTVSPNEREKILKLDWNEATIPPSPMVRRRLEEMLKEPDFFHLYPSTFNKDLLREIAFYTGVDEKKVQYFASSDSLHEYICKLFVAAGDPVVILGPTYDNFRLTCQANGANVFFSNYDADFKFDAIRFEKDIKSVFPAIVYICNPNNPTGYCHEVSYIRHLLTSFPDILFLIDEAYSEFSGVSCAILVNEFDNLIISKTMSKAFALANFRFGYAIAPVEIIDLLNKIRNPKNITSFTQEAALAALRDKEYMLHYVEEVNLAKDFFMDSLAKIGCIKAIESKGNFVLLKMRNPEAKMQLIHHLEKDNIYIRNTTQSPLVANCLRVSIGTRPQMERVVYSINRFVGEKHD